MSRQADRLARKIFLEAVEQCSSQEWPAFLDRRGLDSQVRQRVEVLLRAHLRPDSMLDRFEANRPFHIGSQVGNYHLLQEIGEGGFGVVYRAEQLRPIRRQVALKIIKPGMDTRQVVRRFRAEQQALALMSHPGIAGVLDAGATEAGHPYFVMELVMGQPLTEYCDQRRLGLGARLEIFANVCDAVQHAHEKGIVHRDLKPRNILVADQDGQPQVKVIDFGVAKALHPDLSEQQSRTASSQLLGTPMYMSPEQAQPDGSTVDTRSDVYSLSVVLYELLTGTTPFDRDQLSSVSPLVVPNLLLNHEPDRPSHRFATLKAGSSATARQRSLSRRRLASSLRGELDWIVMKGLEKDPRRRYETARGLGEDVWRFLRGEPLEASPPSFAYKVNRWLRYGRRRQAVWMIIAVTLLLSLLVGVLFHEATRSDRQLALFRRISQQITSQIKTGNMDEADENYRILAAMHKDVLHSPDPGVVSPLFELAGLKCDQRRWDEAYAIIDGMYQNEMAIGNLHLRSRSKVAYFMLECCMGGCWAAMDPAMSDDKATRDAAQKYVRRVVAVKDDMQRIQLGAPAGYSRAWYLVGWYNALLGETSGVEPAIARMIDEDGDRPSKFLLRAIKYDRLGRPELAKAACLVAQDCLPPHPATYIKTRGSRSDVGYREGVQRVAQLTGVPLKHSTDVAAITTLAQAYELILEHYSDDANVRFRSGLVHARLGQWSRALSDFSVARQEDPRQFQHWEAQILAAQFCDQEDLCDKLCRKAFDRFRYTEHLHRLLCLCSLMQGPPAALDQWLHRAEYTVQNDSNWGRLALGAVRYRRGEYGAALAVFPQGEADVPSILGTALRALCRQAQGDDATANHLIRSVRRSLERLPADQALSEIRFPPAEPLLDQLFVKLALRKADPIERSMARRSF